ncbi:MAG TPA: chromosome partitioning protein ParB [Clostridiales bacterium]|jgi:ParB family chromosome partitioning protein|nr:ParB/RepB/Spo0J family partition protein [Clostridiales bacterium]HBL81543.1 chromosome partitioning protein ParB [Clostridiales bacterium]
MKNIEMIQLDRLKPFENHPYKVVENEEMNNLTQSINENGILSPIIVRPIENGEYEIISGHRRLFAGKQAGLTKIPAMVCEMDRDTAAVTLVDSNLHRENILPSEKAYAYKLKAEALSHQGKRTDLTSGQFVPKSDDNRTSAEIGEPYGESYKTVQRYIRLTNLHPKLLEYADEGRIAFTPAVELSYLNDIEQQDLIEIIESEDCTPSLSQAVRMKKLSQQGLLTDDKILEIMSEEKANQKERIKIPTERVRKFFPKSYSNTQIEEVIIKLCEAHYKRKHRDEPER